MSMAFLSSLCLFLAGKLAFSIRMALVSLCSLPLLDESGSKINLAGKITEGTRIRGRVDRGNPIGQDTDPVSVSA